MAQVSLEKVLISFRPAIAHVHPPGHPISARHFIYFSTYLFIVVLGMESRASDTLDRSSPPELHPQVLSLVAVSNEGLSSTIFLLLLGADLYSWEMPSQAPKDSCSIKYMGDSKLSS